MRGSRGLAWIAAAAVAFGLGVGAPPSSAGVADQVSGSQAVVHQGGDQSVAYRADVAHDGALSGPGWSGPLSAIWSDAIFGTDVSSYPVVGQGAVYVVGGVGGGFGSIVLALDAETGATLWSHPLGGSQNFAGLAYDAGRVFAVNSDGVLTAFDAASGTTDWSLQLEGQSSFESSPDAIDGVVYTAGGGQGGTLYANDERTGGAIWTSAEAIGDEDESPTLDASRIYFANPGYYSAYNRSDGGLAWTSGFGGTCCGEAPGVVADGHFYSPPEQNLGGLILSAADGSEQGALASSVPPVVAGGSAYEAVGDGLDAVGEDGLGSTDWSFAGDAPLDGGMLLVGDTLFTSDQSDQVYGLDAATGALRWSANPSSELLYPGGPGGRGATAELAAGGGVLFVQDGDGIVAYAAPGSGAPPANETGPPINEVGPSVGGLARSVDQVVADSGVWTDQPTGYAYQWESCDGSGDECAPIVRATSATLTATDADAGETFRVSVTAVNASGAGVPVVSPASAAVLPRLSVNLTGPTTSGVAHVGETISADSGTWTGSPSGFAYQWLLCNVYFCQSIPGATSATYVPIQAYAGLPLEVGVSALGPGGRSPMAYSAQTNPIVTTIPVNQTPPEVSGSAVEGQILTTSLGTWLGDPAAYSIQWLRCDSLQLDCTAIPGAGGVSYTLTAVDVGQTVKSEVAASNAAGEAPAPVTSAAVVDIVAAPSAGDPGTAGTGSAGAGGSAASGPGTGEEPAGGQSGSPGGGSTSPGADAAPPKVGSATGARSELRSVVVTAPSGLRALIRGGLVSRATCRTSCRLTALAILAGGSRARTATVLGRITKALAGGRATTVKIRITKAGAAALAGRRNVTLTVDFTASNPSVASSSVARTVRIRG
jgi:outer membrane protein assembly factor BamB